MDELEKTLSNGNQLGFVKETNSDDYLGWILLSKRTIPPGTILDPTEGERYIRLKREMDDRLANPYHLKVLELRKDVHESGKYETSKDYRLWENYYFSNLKDATRKISELGYDILQIKPRREIDAP